MVSCFREAHVHQTEKSIISLRVDETTVLALLRQPQSVRSDTGQGHTLRFVSNCNLIGPTYSCSIRQVRTEYHNLRESKLMPTFINTVANVARRGNLFAPDAVEELDKSAESRPQDVEAEWRSWVATEVRRRTALCFMLNGSSDFQQSDR